MKARFQSPISCTKPTLCSAHKDSPVTRKITHSLLFLFLFFCGTKSLRHRLRLRKRIFGETTPCSVSFLRHPSLVKSPLSVQHTKTVPWPKQSHTHFFSFSFFWDQVFASQIKTKEEICWVKLTHFESAV